MNALNKILGSLNKTLAQLEALAETNKRHAAAKLNLIEQLEDEAEALTDEARKASAVADNIRDTQLG